MQKYDSDCQLLDNCNCRLFSIFYISKWQKSRTTICIITLCPWSNITLVQRFQECLVDRLHSQCLETFNIKNFSLKNIYIKLYRNAYQEFELSEDPGLLKPLRLGTCGSTRGPLHSSYWILNTIYHNSSLPAQQFLLTVSKCSSPKMCLL